MTTAIENEERNELKPCPFCGAQPTSRDISHSDETGERYGYWAVECLACQKDGRFCGSHQETEREATAAWNTRRQP